MFKNSGATFVGLHALLGEDSGSKLDLGHSFVNAAALSAPVSTGLSFTTLSNG